VFRYITTVTILAAVLNALPLWVSSSLAEQESETIYTWRGEDGKLHLSDLKPPGAGAQSLQVNKPKKIGTVQPKGSCDPSLRRKSSAKTWVNRSAPRQRRLNYVCRTHRSSY